MRQNRGLLSVLFLIGAAALAIFFAVLRTRTGADHNELVKEAAKAALQVLTVAVLGGVLKLLADHYKEEQERLAQDARFRQDKYDRLVDATNALRRVPILIDADRSLKTFDEQLRQIVEAGLKLRMIKHQIWSSKDVPDPPFTDHRELAYLFESLYHYTDWLIVEFVRAKEPLLDAQQRADNADLTPDEREGAAEQVRLWVPTPCAVEDMLARKDVEAHKSCQAQVKRELELALASEEEIPEPVGSWSWLRYEETEELALVSITKDTFQRRRSWWRNLLSGFKRLLYRHQRPQGLRRKLGIKPSRL
jgi:hypothetical protein